MYLLKNMRDKYRNSVCFLFYIGIFIFSFSRIYQYSLLFDFDSSIKSIIRILSFVLMIPKIVLQQYDKKDYPMIIGLFLLSFLCILGGGDNNIILIPTVLVGMKDIDIKKVITIIFYVTLSALIIHLIAFVIDYGINNKNILTMFHFSSKIVKNTIMYRDNNMYAIRFACCLLQYVYLTNRDKNRIAKTIILFVLSLFVFSISQSRTSFIISILIIMFIIIENNKLFNRILIPLRNLTCVFSIIASLLLVVIGNNASNSFFNKINNLLSGRPSIYSKAVNHIGISLFPNIEEFNNISKEFGSYSIPDNSYISIILKWGIIISLLLAIISFVFIIKTSHSNIINYYLVVIFIWFIAEYISMEIVMYIAPLLCSNVYYSNKN